MQIGFVKAAAVENFERDPKVVMKCDNSIVHANNTGRCFQYKLKKKI